MVSIRCMYFLISYGQLNLQGLQKQSKMTILVVNPMMTTPIETPDDNHYKQPTVYDKPK